MNIYKYISQRVYKYFDQVGVSYGQRFSIRLDKEEDVRFLYESLRSEYATKVVTFKLEKYQTYAFVMDEVTLIVAANVDGIKDDYLTYLRNKVGTDDPIFAKTSLLSIHNSSLDSLNGGSGSLFKEGMPLHLNDIKSNLDNEIDSSKFESHEKIVLQTVLKSREEGLNDSYRNLFDYAPILEILPKEEIEPIDLEHLGLFGDKDLGVNIDRAPKRVAENHSLFEEIAKRHLYGGLDTYLEKKFTEKGVKELLDEDWKNVDYGQILKWIEEKEKNIVPEYLEGQQELPLSNITFWDKADSDSDRGKRNRNIIVFNPDEEDGFVLPLKFTERISVKNFTGISADNIDSKGHKEVHCKFQINDTKCSYFFNIVYSHKETGTKFKFKILVVPFSENILSDFRSTFYLNRKTLVFNTNDEYLIFNPNAEKEIELKAEDGQMLEITTSEKSVIKNTLLDEENDNNHLEFALRINSSETRCRINVETQKPVSISGLEVWKNKREKKSSYIHKIKRDGVKNLDTLVLEHKNSRYFVREVFRNNLFLEKQIIENGIYCGQTQRDNTIAEVRLDINPTLKKAYSDILNFYKNRNALPSLTKWDEELTELNTKFVKLYIKEFESIEEGTPLNQEDIALFRLGTLEESTSYKRLLFTPLHPLNIAYNIKVNEELENEALHESILKKLSPLNLVPFIKCRDKSVYTPIEQEHSPEWLYFESNSVNSQHTSKRFVSSLVSQKIDEFLKHFSFLFPTPNNPLKINLFNCGDCGEVLEGVFKYLKKEITEKLSENKIRPIEIRIYGSSDYVTKFEEISLYEDTNFIKQHFNLDFNSNKIEPQDMLLIYHEKVHFSYIRTNSEEFEYSHISFYQFTNSSEIPSSEVSYSYYDMDEVNSGVGLNGLVADTPSTYIKESYRSCFGTKDYPTESNLLLDLAKTINPFYNVALTQDPYDRKNVVSTVIDRSINQSLDSVYKKSRWVTFISPKVDLSFFKSNDEVIIIHYSDQYNNASGYDAITVTKKSNEYEFIIKEFLRDRTGAQEIDSEQASCILNLYNAVNGDWLLRHNIQKDEKAREKISVLSAMKAMLTLFEDDNIAWVPLSMEEILRVSGSAGLPQNEGFFSKKNLCENKLENISDDLLMVGFSWTEGEELKMYLHPVEVKIGGVHSNVIEKARLQGTKTVELLKKHLNGDGFKSKIYRNFFAKQAITFAEKFLIYEIWPENKKNFQRVIQDFRKRLNNDEFQISDYLENKIGKFSILAFDKNESFIQRSIDKKEDHLLIRLYDNDGLNWAHSPFSDISERIGSMRLFNSEQDSYGEEDYTYRPINPEPNLAANDGTLPNEEDPSEYITAPESVEPIEPMEILFGHKIQNNDPVLWYPTSTDKVMHTNTGIIGTMGTGKTQFTKSLITQLYQQKERNVKSIDLGILIFDYKGDYIKEDFMKMNDAKVYDLYHLPFNPLALSIPKAFKPMLPLHTGNTIKETIVNAFHLGNKQENRLHEAIMQAYEYRGINKGNKNTWDKQAPTLADVYSILLDEVSDKDKDSLYSAIYKLNEFEIFEPEPDKTKPFFDLLNGVTIINLNGYEEDIQNLVVAITLDLFYSQMQAHGHSEIDGNFRQLTKLILVDEADNFLSKNFGTLRKILKEGREFGVGTILSTQFLNHFSTSDNEYSNYILTWIIHRVSELRKKDIESLFSLNSASEKDELMNVIKGLEKHHSIVNLAGSEPILMKDRAFWALIEKDM